MLTLPFYFGVSFGTQIPVLHEFLPPEDHILVIWLNGKIWLNDPSLSLSIHALQQCSVYFFLFRMESTKTALLRNKVYKKEKEYSRQEEGRKKQQWW